MIEQPSAGTPAPTPAPASTIVIVGAGQAGAVAADALRERGHAGRIVLLGREAHLPYERPPLSKDVLCAPDEPVLDVLAAGAYERHGIDWRPDVEVVAIDTSRRQVVLAGGCTVQYERCLLATGGSARLLAGLDRGNPAVHYLRTLDDARRLRSALVPGARVLVIGGGFLGLEMASSARRLNASVDVLEAAPQLLARFVPPACSRWLAQRIVAAGVRLHLGEELKTVAAEGFARAEGIHLETAAGKSFDADVVVVAIGLTPDTGLGQAAGLAIDPVNGGIRVDAVGRTSHPDVYAAGDCASRHCAVAGTHVRYESWQNANEQARAAAAGMLGQDAPPPLYPWFWTDQFGCNLQMLGLAAPGLEYVLRGDPQADEPKAIWLGHRNGVPVHAVAVNAGGDLRRMRVLFERGIALDPAAFADPSQPLPGQVKAAQARVAAAAG